MSQAQPTVLFKPQTPIPTNQVYITQNTPTPNRIKDKVKAIIQLFEGFPST
jgi:hypothetical protein